MENVTDIHYFTLPSQGNIYTLTNLCMSNGSNMVLVASLQRKVFSFEYVQDQQAYLKPVVREVQFTYIPSGAEIISIDAFTKSKFSDDFVIGITIIKCGEASTDKYLHIYSEWEPSTEFNLDSVTQNCQMLELDFIPYQLYHTDLFEDVDSDLCSREVVWLLSGSDETVHMYREDPLKHCYSEVDTLEHFPEFKNPPSVVRWMDIIYIDGCRRRLSAYGCECGYFKLSIVNIGNKEVVSSWTATYDGAVTSVRLFRKTSTVKCPSFLDLNKDGHIGTEMEEEEEMNLLVTSCLQPAIVYMNVIKEGFNRYYSLTQSDAFDAVLCSTLADVNMDGIKEILLGTYEQEILVYKYESAGENHPDSWKLASQSKLANPIHSMLYVDMTGDGVKEFVIATLRGVHIMQHDPCEVQKLVHQRYEEIKHKLSLTDT